jgi:hypothetical protein
MKRILTGLTIATALTMTPVFAQDAQNTVNDLGNSVDTAVRNVANSTGIDWNRNFTNEDELKQWFQDSKQLLDDQKRQAKEAYQRRKDQINSQEQDTDRDNQLQQAENDYKNRVKQIDQEKNRLEDQYKQRQRELKR